MDFLSLPDEKVKHMRMGDERWLYAICCLNLH
jgi:hypothetical protein